MLSPLLALTLSSSALADQPWVSLGDKDGVQVFKRDEGSALFAFRGESVVDVHIGKLVAVQRDPEMAKDWVDLLDTFEFRMVGDTAAHLYMRYDMSWPIQDRDFMVVRDVEQDDDARVYRVLLHSIEDDKWPVDDCCVRAHISRTLWEFTAMPDGHTKVEVEVLTDPGGAIPHWLANAVQKDWPVNSITRLADRARKSDVLSEPGLASW